MSIIIGYLIYKNVFKYTHGLRLKVSVFQCLFLLLVNNILQLKTNKILEIVTKIFHIGIYLVLRISGPFLLVFTLMNPSVHFFFMFFAYMM